MSRNIKILAFCFLAVFGTLYIPQAADAFQPSFTTGVVKRAQSQLEKCRTEDIRPPKPKRFECVAKALEQAAKTLSRRDDYGKAEVIFRKTAAKIRQAKTVDEAVAALSIAKKQLLRSSGIVLREHQRLAAVTDTAKSVLRS